MSKIDMRLTVEEAAKDYAIGKTFFRKNVLKEVDADDYVLRKDNCREDFKADAEWQAKQSPWVSVKDRLPPPGEEVLLFDINSIRHLVLGWLRENKGYNKSMWALSNGHVDDEDITHWMIIPENYG